MCRPEDELVELLWRDGQMILQSQTQTQKLNHHQETLRSNSLLEDQETLRASNLLEDQETISWIQYPLDQDTFETDDLSSSFFSTKRQRLLACPDPRPMAPPKFTLTDASSGNKEQYSVMTTGPSHYGSYQDLNVSMSHDRSKNIHEGLYRNATSSSGGSSGCSFDKNITTDRKRNHVMDTDDESMSKAYVNNKRSSRAAQVHNLSERRRRDRINERIKTLQELITHCSKTDKASILDEAILYLKSLQLQLQIMCLGSEMAASGPVMFPGIHPPPCPVQLPQIQAASQTVEMLRFDSQAGEQIQQPSTAMKTTEVTRLDH